MKYCLIPLVLLFTSCGTTGHISFYDFLANKYDVQKELINVINEDSVHSTPIKWKMPPDEYFERMYVYFKKPPEELYQIGFTMDSTVWKNSSTCRLGLIMQYDRDRWRYESDLGRSEIKRIESRFETEILAKIKYHYVKSE